MAIAGYTCTPRGTETLILSLYAAWRAQMNWLNGPDCAAMDEGAFDTHVEILTRLESRIIDAQAASIEELSAQIDVITFSLKDEAQFHDLRAVALRAGQNVGIAA